MRHDPCLPTGLLRLLAAAVLIFFAAAGDAQQTSPAEPPDRPEVAVGNEFIRIRVNPGPREAGRFAVDTTGGDPSRSSDDDQVLIYGSREPWTSYATMLIDGEPHVFGGPTERRAGVSAPPAPLAEPPRLAEGSLLCRARIGDIEIVQELGLARSPTTRVRDAARITYRVTNRGDRPHVVGLRAMLDTMLGSNDGAPLRAGDRAISAATQLVGDQIPEYWQAFDSLAEPAVISQGTLRAPGLTPPDRLEMVDWGTLADAPWHYPFPEGADFTRSGEAEQDTAVALYWNPEPLAPGESRRYATLYGVGGVTLSPAQLSLGLTAPAEADYQYEDPRAFAVTAYVENSGGFDARGTNLALTLSEGLALADGPAAVPLGLLPAGQTRQATWRVVPNGKATGTLQIAAVVTSENLEPNRVARDIVVNSPPQLDLSLRAPHGLAVTADNRYMPNPFLVRADVANRGSAPSACRPAVCRSSSEHRPPGRRPPLRVQRSMSRSLSRRSASTPASRPCRPSRTASPPWSRWPSSSCPPAGSAAPGCRSATTPRSSSRSTFPAATPSSRAVACSPRGAPDGPPAAASQASAASAAAPRSSTPPRRPSSPSSSWRRRPAKPPSSSTRPLCSPPATRRPTTAPPADTSS
jgi:hypothetical protein